MSLDVGRQAVLRYESVHGKLMHKRGAATEYRCVDCGSKAAEWSYDHTDPDELHQAGRGPYSMDLARYLPRCSPCHQAFDKAFRLEQVQQGGLNPQPWSTAELRYLREHGRDGAKEVAKALGRSVAAVTRQAQKQRVSLRRRGNRQGLLMGQPRGVSWLSVRQVGMTPETMAEIREAVVRGSIDLTALEGQLQALAKGEELPLCPTCSARPQNHPSGVCRVCHMRALAQTHRDGKEIETAQRALWTERQRKKRRIDRKDRTS